MSDNELFENQSHEPSAASPQSESGSVSVTPCASVTSKLDDSKKRKLTSDVWKHMKKICKDGGDWAVCNKCNKNLKAGSKQGTSSLKKHLVKCLAKSQETIDVALRKQAQMPIDVALRKQAQMQFLNANSSEDSFDQGFAEKEIARAIVLHEYPISMVDHIGFRNLCSSLQPRFKTCSRTTIKKEIFNLYDHEKKTLREMLEEDTGCIAVTVDMWTSNQEKDYMSITAHFVDNDWVLQSRVLRFIYVPAPQSVDVLAENLMDGLTEWNLETRLSTITVNNCSTSDLMVVKVVDRLSSDCLLSGKYVHMRCGAHILNLIVKDGMDVMNGAIEIIRDSVSYWSATPSRVKKFEEMARSLKISCIKKLVLDCETRWDSTYLMLQVAIQYKDVFSKIRNRDRNYACVPSDDDWDLVGKICEKLKVFYSAAEYLSGNTYPTAHGFFVKICKIKEALSDWMKSQDEVIVSMSIKMNDKFDKYWSIVHVMMTIAAILDPRLKLRVVNYYFPKFYGAKASDEVENIKKVMYDLVEEYQSKVKGEGSEYVEILSHRESDKVEDFDNDLLEYLNAARHDVSMKYELDYYLDEAPLKIGLEVKFDILNWWKVNGIKYPTLQLIARDVLAIPVSTVASESVFSTDGSVVASHRSSLHPKTLEVLMCCQSWSWNAVGGSVVVPETKKNTSEEDDGSPNLLCITK